MYICPLIQCYCLIGNPFPTSSRIDMSDNQIDYIEMLGHLWGAKLIQNFLYVAFLWTACSPLAAQNILDERFDFAMQNETLQQGLWRLSEAIETPIIFSDRFFSSDKYSYSFKSTPLRMILKKILDDTETSYSIDNHQILILREGPLKKYTISGYLEDAETGESLILANIYDKVSRKGTSTNSYGFFSLTLEEGEKQLQFSYLGYQTFENKILLDRDHHMNLQLKPSLTLQEVVVSGASPETDFYNASYGESLGKNEVELLPALGGEVDIMRGFRQLPGIQTGVDGFGGLYVRGGNADQNLVLLDGVRVYNPFHGLGLFSIFDRSVVRRVNYFRGQFPARFGGRLSSVVDVRTKEGNNKEFRSEASIGLIASKLTVEGPMVKHKGAFLFSARRTHLDPFIKSYSKTRRTTNESPASFNYFFGDILGKLNYSLSDKDHIYLSFYNGRDRYQNSDRTEDTFETLSGIFEKEQVLDWGNTLSVLRWNRQFGNKLFANFILNYSIFKFNSGETLTDQIFENGTKLGMHSFQSLYLSEIKNLTGKVNLDYVPNSQHYLKMGLSSSTLHFAPGIANAESDSVTFVEIDEFFADSILNANRFRSSEIAFFAEDEWQPHPDWLVNAGIYNSLFFTNGKIYILPEPRLSVHWKTSSALQSHISINKMSQFLHVLTRSGSGLPNDLWVPSTAKISPQQAWLFDTGVEYVDSEKWYFSSSAYWKKMTHLLSFLENNSATNNSQTISSENWENLVTTGSGESYGLEFLAKKQKGKATGQFAYTLSKTTREFKKVNGGKTFPFKFDLRHVLNINTHYKLNPNWALSLNWNYSSGANISLGLRQWQYINQSGKTGVKYLDYGEKNSYKLPPYHQLDIRTNYQKQKSWGSLSFLLGVYNVYNRKNLFNIQARYNSLSADRKYVGISLIPLLPYFGVNVNLF